jgi:hypothetical protein
LRGRPVLSYDNGSFHFIFIYFVNLWTLGANYITLYDSSNMKKRKGVKFAAAAVTEDKTSPPDRNVFSCRIVFTKLVYNI